MNRRFEIIASRVPQGSRVLDLGCGAGAMLEYLRDRRGCSVQGVEIDPDKLVACARRDVDVLQLDLEQGLSMFADASFDVVLLIDSLPNLRHTEAALREAARVGRLGIATFANFAFWKIRLRLAGGRLPVTEELPYEWYDTPNLRVATHADFGVLAAKCELSVREAIGIEDGREVTLLPNLLASEAMYVFSAQPAARGLPA
jgi:methionine biosynthesis protein MetW